MIKTYLFLVVLGALIGGALVYQFKPEKKCPELTSQTIDTIWVSTPKDSVPYKPNVINKKEKVNVDSIWLAAKKYWEQIHSNSIPVDYEAVSDTSLNDENISGTIAFRSRIPLDPDGYFRLNLKTKKEVVTNNYIETKETVYKDTWNVGFGAAAHFADSVRVNLFGSLTYKIINLKHFELPVSAEIEFDDNFRMIDKKIIIGGKIKF